MRPEILHDLVLFVKVVDHSSYTKAALSLNLSKSMVSKNIMRLEKNLGAQLLNRSTRVIRLTETGKAIYERAKDICDNADELEQTVSSTHLTPQGNLKIAAPQRFGQLHLTPAITDFLKLYPKIKVQLLLGREDEDLIENGIDIAIRIGKLQDSNLIARRLTTRRMSVCASPEYIEQFGKPNHPEDLLKHNCLRHKRSPTGYEWHFKNNNDISRIKIKGNFSANSSQALEEAAIHGLGIAMLPGYIVTKDIQQGYLVNLLKEYCLTDIGVHALYPHNRHLAYKVRIFIDFLVERFSDNSYWNLD